MEFNANNNEYIDIEDALKRTGGNRDLYKRLLKRFVEGNDIEALEAALTSGDMEEASHVTHTLKGVSANLSLVGINTASINLEQAIKGGLEFTECFNALVLVYGATVKIIADMTK